MPVTNQKLVDEPVIVSTYENPFDPRNDIPRAHQEIAGLMQAIEGNVYVIVDVTNLTGDFNVLVEALALSARGKDGSTADPRRKTVIVGSGALLQLGANAMQQEQYGSINTPLFGSYDEALAHVRAQL